MRRRTSSEHLAAFGLVLAAIAGCYSGQSGAAPTAVGPGAPAEDADGGAVVTNPTGALTSDVPCDVATLLRDKCQSCHAATPVGGAPMALMTRADLTRTSVDDPSKTIAELAVARMQATNLPMPPAPAAHATSDDIAALTAWIADGYSPGNACAGDADAGAPTDPTNTPVVCTSNTTWTRGDHGSSSMHPGRACIDCHSKNNGPSLDIAGSVFPTYHEPDDCNGIGTTATVVITDANGKVTKLAVNKVGNFYGAITSLAPPFTAKVVTATGERAMAEPQTSGDCNGCHTQQGANGAPGRITSP